jgi:hypothetical protein
MTLQITRFVNLSYIMLLRGEITTLDHYRFLEGKTKGARSMPYYSIAKYFLLPYFIITTHIINKKS